MLETMMQQLMSKEILYEPLKELKEQVCVFNLSDILNKALYAKTNKHIQVP